MEVVEEALLKPEKNKEFSKKIKEGKEEKV